MKNKELYICRICWFENDFFVWGELWESPSFRICPCCGTEFWYEDCQLSAIKENRKKWLSSQIKWFDENKKPDNWDLEEQIKNIPKKYL